MEVLKRNLWAVGLLSVVIYSLLVTLGVLPHMPGTIFGFMDNGIVCFGAYLGVNVEERIANRLDRPSSPVFGAVVGSTLFNLISDWAGAMIDSSMDGMAVGIVIGCLLPILLIGTCERIRSTIKK